MPTEKIKYSDNLKQGTDKLNSAIEAANVAETLSTNADTKATQALSNSVNTQEQLDTIVIEGDSSVEAAQARVPVEGTAYPTLKARLDAEYNGLTADLAENAYYIDKNSPKFVNEKIANLFRQSKEGLADVTYIMVGDSTRASNGAHIYAMVSPVLRALSVNTILQARSGLKAQHWGASVPTVQPGFPQASELIPQIPGTGATTIIDICLGINDNVNTVAQIKGYIKAGIDLIKASKPDVLFNLTSPNIRNSTEFYKLPIVFKELTEENGYGYINVAENVWKNWSDTTGYFLDADHPNEFGQKKMGEYILSKLVPEDLRLSYLSNIPVPKGYLSDVATNDPIRASGFRIEVIYTTGTPTGVMYLRKLTDNQWYLYDATTGDSISYAIPMKNGQQTISGGFLAARKIKALITIKDHTVLDAVANGTTLYPLEEFLVTDFTKNKTLSQSVFELTESDYDAKRPITILRGSIDKTDPNYAALKGAGLRIELQQTVGTPYTNLYLKKSGAGKWALYPQTSGDQISNDLVMVNGVRDVKKVSFNTTSDFNAKVSIDDFTVLNTFADTTSYIKLKHALVTETPRGKTVKEHLKTLYDAVFI